MKILRQHADDGVRNLIYRYLLPDDVRFAAKTLLPGSIAKNQSARCFGQIFAGIEITTENRSHAQRTEEAVTYPCAVNLFRSRGGCCDKSALTVDVQRNENSIEFLPIEIICI